MNFEGQPSTPASRFSINLHDVTRRRLGGIDSHELKPVGGDASYRLWVAAPVSYGAKTAQRYPLVVLLNTCSAFGSAVEMSRLMAQTREIRECILICLEIPIESESAAQLQGRFIVDQLLPWCREHYRVASGPAVVFSGLAGIAEILARSADTHALLALPGSGKMSGDPDPVPVLVSGLRQHLGTGHQYGSELVVLSKPFISKILSGLQPVIGRLLSKKIFVPHSNGPHLIRAKKMERDFEVFAVLPESAAANPSRRYPALLVLDANLELSTAAEAAARLARHGQIEEIMVIGIGVPRSEGMIEFGFRRFEEFSPPPDGYLFDDRLGRVFRSLFATRGKDARQCVGKAAQLHSFIIDDLLPLLVQQLPINEDNLGILGHSAGGTFVGYTLFQEHSPFHNYASISPGVGMSGSWLMRDPQASRPVAKSARQAFFCVGGDEKTNHFCAIAGIPDTEALSHQIQMQQSDLKVTYRCFDGETHSTIYAPAVAQTLRAVYGFGASGFARVTSTKEWVP